jgi:hypothetical protein
MSIRLTVFLLFILISLRVTHDSFAKRLKLFRVTIIHYDNTRTSGILYAIKDDGFYLVNAKEIRSIRTREISPGIETGNIKPVRIAFEQIKNVALRRRAASGRGFLI